MKFKLFEDAVRSVRSAALVSVTGTITLNRVVPDEFRKLIEPLIEKEFKTYKKEYYPDSSKQEAIEAFYEEEDYTDLGIESVTVFGENIIAYIHKKGDFGYNVVTFSMKDFVPYWYFEDMVEQKYQDSPDYEGKCRADFD